MSEPIKPSLQGFQPFFFAASSFAIVSMVIWTALYSLNWQGAAPVYAAMTWHAHAMIFGYAVAVIAGFLLTAIVNWTGRPTVQGWPLWLLFTLWLLARCLPFTYAPLWLTAVMDLSFMLLLILACAKPIVQARQWQQAGILGKLILISLANATFYLAALQGAYAWQQIGLYAGFYLIVALILTMGRRIIPFFAERGLETTYNPRNNAWVDRASLLLFLIFMLAELVHIGSGHRFAQLLAGGLALLQFPLHLWRLAGWYDHGIWRKPLLWVLFIAYGWLTLGFLLKALSVVLLLSPWLAVHAFAYGGMGMMTAGMMARVILGHTEGQDVATPPKVICWIFALLFLGSVARVLLPMLWLSAYTLWIILAQGFWIAAFSVFAAIYWPMLWPRRFEQN